MTTMQSHDRLQQLLQLVAQSLHWTYAIFWHLCPQRGVLVWRDGYYNGAIKTRKTVQPTEVSMEDVALQRSRQLRELYDALSAGEANAPARRSCAALSPEDLTESEWFFLMCISFSFPPDDGLPGKAYAQRKHVWLTRANEADSRVFSRAILAKSAGIQTVACIPLEDGVLELGSLDKVEEDMGVVQQARSYFSEQDEHCLPALSGHSTSTPANADHPLLVHTQQLPIVTPMSAAHVSEEEEGDDDDEEEEEEDDDDEEEEEEDGVYCEDEGRVEMERIGARVNGDEEPSELMRLEMSEGIRLGSPDDCSENLNSELRMLAMGQHATRNNEHGTYQAWQHLLNDDLCNSPAHPSGSPEQIQDLCPEDAHYSDTVSAILNNNPSRWTDFSSVSSITGSMNSAFTEWTCSSEIPPGFHGFSAKRTTPPQWVLKFILFSVPRLHYKHSRGEGDHCIARFSRRSIPQEELTANHVLAERRRREKLNERFVVLRSLVPFVTKMDKASILADTIEYVKRLRRQIQELESRNRQFEINSEEQNHQMIQANKSCSSQTKTLRNKALLPDKRKLRMLERRNKNIKMAAASCANNVQVSVIETDALLELQCPYRDGLLLKIIQTLHELKVETTSLQSSTTNGVFSAEIRAKVKGKRGKKASITEVKEAIDLIIQRY